MAGIGLSPRCVPCDEGCIHRTFVGIVETECGGTRAETRFGLSAKWTSPFLSAGVSVQSAASIRSMRFSGSNAG